jgi:hypothetical protein
MGQVALGFRSLLIKATVFVMMAACLAWALGGTLWPRAETADFDAVMFDGRSWFWRISVGGAEPGAVSWQLMNASSEEEPRPFRKDRVWREVAGPVTTDEALYFGGCVALGADRQWGIERVDRGGETQSFPMPDRLAVERQLARAAASLPLQDAETIHRLRQRVLEPPDDEDKG